MTFLFVKDGVAVNRVDGISQEAIEAVVGTHFDHIVRIDQLSPSPGIGWAYDGQDFSPPETP